MGFRFSHLQENKESPHFHEATFGELSKLKLVGLEGGIARLRRILVIVYLAFLWFTTDPSLIVGSRETFSIAIGVLLLFQVVFWWLERKYPHYRWQGFRVVRFLYYIFSAAAILFIGRGSAAFALLFVPYLVLAGVYVGAFWGFVGSLLSAILSFVVYYALSSFDLAHYTSEQILIRMLAIFSAGAIPTYFWLGYFRYRNYRIDIENKLFQIASELTSTLDFELVLQKAFNLLKNLVNFETGLIVADLDRDDDYTVLASWNYPTNPDLHFNTSDGSVENEGETLTGEVLKTKRSLLVLDVVNYKIRTKYPEIGPGRKLHSYLGVPILFGQDLFGVFMITSDQTAAFSESDREYMELFSRWLAIAIKNGVAHKQLNELGRYHQEIIDLADEGILAADSTGRIVLYNVAAKRLLGLTREELRRTTASSLYASGISEAKRVMHEIEAGSGKVRDIKSEIFTKSGKTIPVLLSAATLRDPDGRLNSVGYFRDLRELPIPEQRLRTLLEVSTLSSRYPMKNIREQSQRIIEIFDKDADGKYAGMLLLSEGDKLNVVAASPALDIAELQNFSIGRRDGISGEVLTGDRVEFVENVREDPRYSFPYFANAYDLHSGLFIPLKYGEMNIGTFTIYSIGDEDFPIIDREYYINFGSQVSIVLATLELTQTYLRQRALALTAKVASGSAYGMRNPLTLIRGWTQMLQFRTDLKEIVEENQFSEIVGNIERATRDLQRLIDELIRATEELDIKFEPVDLYSLVTEIIQNPIVKTTAFEENIKIRIDGNPTLVQGDRNLLFQAINNVIQNALDAQPTGGEINIRLVHSPNGEARIIILDQGPGISFKDFDETADIFLPFSSTKPGARRQSFGLSLAYTQKIIEAHGGTISARNNPDSGAEIEIVMTPADVFTSAR